MSVTQKMFACAGLVLVVVVVFAQAVPVPIPEEIHPGKFLPFLIPTASRMFVPKNRAKIVFYSVYFLKTTAVVLYALCSRNYPVDLRDVHNYEYYKIHCFRVLPVNFAIFIC